MLLSQLMMRKKLLVINFQQKLSFQRSVDIGRKCRGASVSRDHIFVSSVDIGSVVLELNKRGQLTRLFVIDWDLNCAFLWLPEDDKLTRISSTGDLHYSYPNKNFREPRDVVVDDEANALVCFMSSNKIHVKKSDGTFHKTLLEPNTTSKPYLIAFKSGILALDDWYAGCLHRLELKSYLLR